MSVPYEIFLTVEHMNFSIHTQIVYELIACHNFDLRLFGQVQCVSHIFCFFEATLTCITLHKNYF